jgi:transaldolase
MVIYLDGADLDTMRELGPQVRGFTTNPSLMKKAGINNYRAFAKEVLSIVKDKPVSFEVFADDELNMERQAEEIADWGKNVYVKIPVTNTRGESCGMLINRLGNRHIQVNVTAVCTLEQVWSVCRHISPVTPSILSIFAGRIADTGRNPVPFITAALLVKHDKTKILWASTREALNVKQAEQAGCNIITLSPDLIRKKRELFGKDLAQYSLETVQQFHDDAKGLTL